MRMPKSEEDPLDGDEDSEIEELKT
jgi:hypothetical protein